MATLSHSSEPRVDWSFCKYCSNVKFKVLLEFTRYKCSGFNGIFKLFICYVSSVEYFILIADIYERNIVQEKEVLMCADMGTTVFVHLFLLTV